jgi:hypothetical protein
MTGFIAYVSLYPNRVSLHEALEVLEPDDGKLSRPVLRGPGPSNGARLLDRWALAVAADAEAEGILIMGFLSCTEPLMNCERNI